MGRAIALVPPLPFCLLSFALPPRRFCQPVEAANPLLAGNRPVAAAGSAAKRYAAAFPFCGCAAGDGRFCLKRGERDSGFL